MDPSLMKSLNGRHANGGNHRGNDSHEAANHEVEQLRAENEELRTLVLELEREIHQRAASPAPAEWESQAREFEALLEEKSELIRHLHRRIQELEEERATAPSTPARANVPVPREEELMRLSEELERERRQLKEDEESLMEQMREMEVQMARERAELARQRTELQRLQNDLRHELETAARDAALRERLMPLQRRYQDAVVRRGSAPPPTTNQPAQENTRPANEPSGARTTSGLFRRLFGGGNGR